MTYPVLLCILFAGPVMLFIALRGRVYTMRRTLRRHRVKNANGRYIYAFTDWGQVIPVVKIGRATDVKARLSAHRTAAPFGLLVFTICKVNDSHRAERYLHDRYAMWRIRQNGEWFLLTPGILFDLLVLNDFDLRRQIDA